MFEEMIEYGSLVVHVHVYEFIFLVNHMYNFQNLKKEKKYPPPPHTSPSVNPHITNFLNLFS